MLKGYRLKRSVRQATIKARDKERAGLPAVVFSMAILWGYDHSAKVRYTMTVVIVLFWFGFAFSAREVVVTPLRTLANLLEAMREGDYSIRGRGAGRDDALLLRHAPMFNTGAAAATLTPSRNVPRRINIGLRGLQMGIHQNRLIFLI